MIMGRARQQRPEGRGGSVAEDGPGATGSGEAAGPASEPDGAADTPAGLLSEISRLRRDARSARHAYWLPLVLFGLVIGASAPFYLGPSPSHPGTVWFSGSILPWFGGL